MSNNKRRGTYMLKEKNLCSPIIYFLIFYFLTNVIETFYIFRFTFNLWVRCKCHDIAYINNILNSVSFLWNNICTTCTSKSKDIMFLTNVKR